MSKPKEVAPLIVSSQKLEDNYNLESKKEKVKKMGASRLVMRMFEKDND